MSEISITEIKSMSKLQNYMRGYEDGMNDVLDKIKTLGREPKIGYMIPEIMGGIKNENISK